jgi:hypothetical protein
MTKGWREKQPQEREKAKIQMYTEGRKKRPASRKESQNTHWRDTYVSLCGAQ